MITMKKLFLIISVIAGLLSSCSNEYLAVEDTAAVTDVSVAADNVGGISSESGLPIVEIYYGLTFWGPNKTQPGYYINIARQTLGTYPETVSFFSASLAYDGGPQWPETNPFHDIYVTSDAKFSTFDNQEYQFSHDTMFVIYDVCACYAGETVRSSGTANNLPTEYADEMRELWASFTFKTYDPQTGETHFLETEVLSGCCNPTIICTNKAEYWLFFECSHLVR